MENQEIHGYHGRIPRLDLSLRTFNSERLSPEDLCLFFGRIGLEAVLLLRELPAKTETRSDENLFIFPTGSLVGAAFPGSDRSYRGAWNPADARAIGCA